MSYTSSDPEYLSRDPESSPSASASTSTTSGQQSTKKKKSWSKFKSSIKTIGEKMSSRPKFTDPTESSEQKKVKKNKNRKTGGNGDKPSSSTPEETPRAKSPPKNLMKKLSVDTPLMISTPFVGYQPASVSPHKSYARALHKSGSTSESNLSASDVDTPKKSFTLDRNTKLAQESPDSGRASQAHGSLEGSRPPSQIKEVASDLSVDSDYTSPSRGALDDLVTKTERFAQSLTPQKDSEVTVDFIKAETAVKPPEGAGQEKKEDKKEKIPVKIVSSPGVKEKIPDKIVSPPEKVKEEKTDKAGETKVSNEDGVDGRRRRGNDRGSKKEDGSVSLIDSERSMADPVKPKNTETKQSDSNKKATEPKPVEDKQSAESKPAKIDEKDQRHEKKDIDNKKDNSARKENSNTDVKPPQTTSEKKESAEKLSKPENKTTAPKLESDEKKPPATLKEEPKTPSTAPKVEPKTQSTAPKEEPKKTPTASKEERKTPSTASKEEPKTTSTAPKEEPKTTSTAPKEEPKTLSTAPKDEPKTPSTAPKEEQKKPPTASKEEPKKPSTAPKEEPKTSSTAPKEEPKTPSTAPKEEPKTKPEPAKKDEPKPKTPSKSDAEKAALSITAKTEDDPPLPDLGAATPLSVEEKLQAFLSAEGYSGTIKDVPAKSSDGSQQPDKRECLYKILVIGELGTGKTSIIKRYVHQFFSQHYRATIGVDFALKVLNWDPNTIIRLQLWDIAGQERFGNMTRVYYKEAVGAFIVFDVTRSATFDAVLKWKQDLDSKVQLADGSHIPCVLLANKCDQQKEGIVNTPAKMDEYCKENNFSAWFETSAKENINIDEAAKCLVTQILQNDKSSQNGRDSARDGGKFPLDGKSEQESKGCAC